MIETSPSTTEATMNHIDADADATDNIPSEWKIHQRIFFVGEWYDGWWLYDVLQTHFFDQRGHEDRYRPSVGLFVIWTPGVGRTTQECGVDLRTTFINIDFTDPRDSLRPKNNLLPCFEHNTISLYLMTLDISTSWWKPGSSPREGQEIMISRWIASVDSKLSFFRSSYWRSSTIQKSPNTKNSDQHVETPNIIVPPKASRPRPEQP